MLPDGAVEMTLECVPRRRTFKNGYIASPESGTIHFLGHP